MARCVERQPAHRIDIIFQFTYAFAGVRINPGEILRIITGKDQAFRPNPLKRAIERDNTALEACHIEIDAIVIVGKWFLQRAETVALADQSSRHESTDRSMPACALSSNCKSKS
jgi:hypothetical protein